MSEDLLHKLTRAVREDRRAEDARLPEQWDALAAGTLSAGEEEELRAVAGESPAAALAHEAFRPLDAEFHDRVVAAARPELRSAVRAPAPATATAGRRRRWLPASALAAAAVLLFLLWPGADQPAPLPTYRLLPFGGNQTWRSSVEEQGEVEQLELPPMVLNVGNQLRLVLRPDIDVDGPVDARAFVLTAAGPRPLEAPLPEIVAEGTVRFSGEIGSEVRLPMGDAFLLLVVGRPDSLPAGEELRSRLADRDDVSTAFWAGWKVPVTTISESAR